MMLKKKKQYTVKTCIYLVVRWRDVDNVVKPAWTEQGTV